MNVYQIHVYGIFDSKNYTHLLLFKCLIVVVISTFIVLWVYLNLV